MQSIQKVTIIGSGLMGSQIAAHIANAGVPVLLLDIVPMEARDRNEKAKTALERLSKMTPSPYMHDRTIDLITPGNIEDDLPKIKESDWIIEALLDHANIKVDFYKRIQAHRKPGSIVSTSSSALSITSLMNELPDALAGEFLITQFANPPRQNRHVELIAGPQTRPDVVEFIADFCDRRLGKLISFKREGATDEGEPLMAKEPIGFLFLSDIKKYQTPLATCPAATIWDCGEKVLCLEFTTKMNRLNVDSFMMINRALSMITPETGYKGLVIYSDQENFSVGADLNIALSSIRAGLWEGYEEFIKLGQQTFNAIRYAPFPTVAAVTGFAVGGGCELALHASAIQAYAESYMGLVEVSMGGIPVLGGCTQMLVRAAIAQSNDEVMAINKIFENICLSKTSRSAIEARDFYYLASTDGITMNRDRLFFDARQRVIDMAKEYHAPKPQKIKFAGTAGRSVFNLVLEGLQTSKALDKADLAPCRTLIDVFCSDAPGGAVSEIEAMEIERKKGLPLLHRPDALARIEAILGKAKKKD